MSDKIADLHRDISFRLNQIAELFDEKEVPKMTLVIRTPWLNDGGVLIGNDDYDEAIKEINRLRTAQLFGGDANHESSPDQRH